LISKRAAVIGRQRLLSAFSNSEGVREDMAFFEIKMLNWNIANPSVNRAHRQFEWLMEIGANVIILTEAKYSGGSLYLGDALESVGFTVYFPVPENNDYCVIIAEKGFNSTKWRSDLSFLSHRLESVVLHTFLGDLKIMGMYVPSRGPKEKKNINKRSFQNQIAFLLRSLYQNGEANNMVVGGDLNVIEPDHIPPYSIFGDWEYEFYDTFGRSGLCDVYKLLHPHTQEHSWIGKYHNGYRFDHLFVSQNIKEHVTSCSYAHEPRDCNLSDHSAMILVLRKPSVRL